MEKKKKIIKKSNFTFNFNKKKFKFFSKYIGMLIKKGKKSSIENGFFSILRKLKKENNMYHLSEYLKKSINQVRPFLALIVKKKGSVSYSIPVSITIKREIFQAIYWTINETCGIKKGNYKELLLKEFINLSSNSGNAVKAKKVLHKIGEQNRVYIKYLV